MVQWIIAILANPIKLTEVWPLLEILFLSNCMSKKLLDDWNDIGNECRHIVHIINDYII